RGGDLPTGRKRVADSLPRFVPRCRDGPRPHVSARITRVVPRLEGALSEAPLRRIGPSHGLGTHGPAGPGPCPLRLASLRVAGSLLPLFPAIREGPGSPRAAPSD